MCFVTDIFDCGCVYVCLWLSGVVALVAAAEAVVSVVVVAVATRIMT